MSTKFKNNSALLLLLSAIFSIQMLVAAENSFSSYTDECSKNPGYFFCTPELELD